MAVTNLLPAGSTAATSASFTLTGGQTMTLAGAARAGQGGTIYWRADVERLMSDGAWEPVGCIDLGRQDADAVRRRRIPRAPP